MILKNKIFSSFLILFLLFSCKEKVEEKIEEEPLEQIAETKVVSDSISESSVENNPQEKFDLPFEIEGKYHFEDEVASCKMSLEIFSVKGILKYKWETGARTINGDAEISKEENGNYCITFKGIEWSENKGFIDPEGDTPEENLPIPTTIMAGLRDHQIIFQNYGNAENYFVILKECDVKYVFLEKV